MLFRSLELLRWPGICSHVYFELESNLNEWGIFFFFKKIFEGIKSCAIEPTLWKGTVITLNCNAIHAFRGISWCVHTAFLGQKNIVKQIKKISPVAFPFWNNFLKAQCISILYLHVLKCLSPHKLTIWVPSRLYPMSNTGRQYEGVRPTTGRTERLRNRSWSVQPHSRKMMKVVFALPVSLALRPNSIWLFLWGYYWMRLTF